jgi:hypothetical protein
MPSRAFHTGLVACFGLAAACVGSETVDPYTKCAVQAMDQNWVTAEMDVDVNLPSHCPFVTWPRLHHTGAFCRNQRHL